MMKAKIHTFKENVGKCFCNLRVTKDSLEAWARRRDRKHREPTKGSDDCHQLN